MTKRLLSALFATLAAVSLFAQSGGVKGVVINRDGREPVENASLVLLQGAERMRTQILSEQDRFVLFLTLPRKGS